MQGGVFEPGGTVPLLIPDTVWRESKRNGVSAAALSQLQAEHGAAVGYEFAWGQIIEGVFDANATFDPGNLDDVPHAAVFWHFVLSDVYTEFLDAVAAAAVRERRAPRYNSPPPVTRSSALWAFDESRWLRAGGRDSIGRGLSRTNTV